MKLISWILIALVDAAHFGYTDILTDAEQPPVPRYT